MTTGATPVPSPPVADAQPFAVIAGGGTAGHVLPGVAVAQALVARGHDPGSIVFVGSNRGVEGALVPAAGFPLVALPGRGIARRLTLDNVGAVVGLVRAVWRALWLVRRWRPAVVVSLGGYASVPGTVAAVVWRIPLVVTEQNAVPGAANRLAARFAAAVAVPFAGPDSEGAVVTGNPVRAEVSALTDPAHFAATRAAMRGALGIGDDERLVAVFSGSLGARRVNLAVCGLAARWSTTPPPGAPVTLVHVTGRRDHDLVLAELDAAGVHVGPRSTEATSAGVRVDVVGYEDHMDRLLAAADVAVCRAGGTTVAELSAIGLPAVLVPLPGAPGDHQTANAGPLVASGGAVLLDDASCTPDALDTLLVGLLADATTLPAMSVALRGVGRPDAAEAVAELVEEHARVA